MAFRRSFGPGLLWAAAAIGVSHLVQSTRAGAQAGLGLLVVIVLALVLKYPFFEYGPRYAASTGRSLVEGYARIGRWALWLYLGITLGTALIVQSVIVLFTSFLLRYALGVAWSVPLTAALLMAACALLLRVGRYKALDLAIKILVALLAVSTLAAAAVTWSRVDFATIRLWPSDLVGSVVPFAFVLALVGWMPSAIDIAAWNSLWTLAKNESCGSKASVAAARLDFLVGYLGTSVLAFAFVLLGAGVMFGTGEGFSPQGTVFATQLVDLYTAALGDWTRPVVLVAVVTTMLSTALTVIDGFPRVIERSVLNLIDGDASNRPFVVGRIYWIAMGALFVLSLVVLGGFLGSITAMVDFATIVSFLTAPILGWMNLRAITSSLVPREHRPGKWMLAWSWLGLVLLGGTGLVYLARLAGLI